MSLYPRHKFSSFFKLFSVSLFLLLIFITISQINNISAQGAPDPGGIGTSCCQAGYIAYKTACIPQDYMDSNQAVGEMFISLLCGEGSISIEGFNIPIPGIPLPRAAKTTINRICNDTTKRQDMIDKWTNVAYDAINTYASSKDRGLFADNFCEDSSQFLPVAQQIYKNTCLTVANNIPMALMDKWAKVRIDSFDQSCDAGLFCIEDGAQGICSSTKYDLCIQIGNQSLRHKCVVCESTEGLWTAIGCIPTRPESVVRVLIKIGLTIGGGVALLMILVGSFRISTSAGDPKAVNEAKDQITSAIIGLIFIIFSVTILQFIGVQIFQLPGFGQ